MKETRHLGVYGLIIKNNEIALVLKSRGAYKGKLDLPGGSFEHGERPEEALIREIKEELNADVKNAELFDTESIVVNWFHHEEEAMHHIGIFYKVELKNTKLKEDADGLDSLGSKWYDIDKLKEDDVAPLVWIELKKLKLK
ncbi:MAG: NUDIX domain-containing protein [Mollicutes bacterium]|nr:NUDIX domain-containing protein [Mollicutes bacterium]